MVQLPPAASTILTEAAPGKTGAVKGERWNDVKKK